MDDMNVELRTEVPQYKPSWIDRFNDWTETLPVRAWVFYVASGGLLVLVQILFLWLEGGSRGGELLPIIIFNGLATPYLLALFHLLNNQAVAALRAMRPVLDTTEAEFELYEYQISTMPSTPPMIAGLAMLFFMLILEHVALMPIRYAALEQLPIFAVIFNVIDKSSAFLFGVFIYHTIRQLLLANTINANLVRLNLFNLGPTTAFSRLTSSTAVGLVIGVYGFVLINPELVSDPVNLVFVVAITVLAVAVFVSPLYCVHRTMDVTKEAALHEIDLLFEVVSSKFNVALRDDNYTMIERLNGIIASLETQRRRIEVIPTWPWRPDTVRPVLTAIAIPVILMILQFIIEQLLNG